MEIIKNKEVRSKEKQNTFEEKHEKYDRV